MIKYIALLAVVATALSCSPNCAFCTGTYCDACNDGFALTYDFGCIQQSLSHCTGYYNSSSCFNCQITYQLVNNTCELTYDGCVQRDSFDGSCLKCMFGKILVENKCVGTFNCLTAQKNCTQCKPSFTLSGSLCLDTTPNCLSYSLETGVCQQCRFNYELIGYECVNKDSRVLNCDIYNNDKKCLICKSGYQLNLAFQCVLAFSSQEYTTVNVSNSINSQSNICLVPNPNSPEKCLVCIENYYTSNGTCLPVSSLCDNYNPETGDCTSCKNLNLYIQNGKCIDLNCERTNGSQCLACRIMFSLDAHNLCVYNDTNCITAIVGANRCQTCNPSYFVSLQGYCKILPSNCSNVDLSTERCINCVSGYILVNQSICLTILRIANCLTVDQNNRVCSLCQNGYYVSGSSCAKVSALCVGYDMQSGNCLNCFSGFQNIGGKCIDLNCLTSVNDQCQTCKPNYRVVASNSPCTYWDPNCASLTIIDCSSCMPGYSLVLGRCLKIPLFCIGLDNFGNCKSCLETYSMISGICVKPISNCINYSQTSNDTKCDACGPNYVLTNNTCLTNSKPTANTSTTAGSNQKDLNCIKFSGSVCVNCSNKYYLSPSGCVPVNPLCKDFNSTNGNCTSCYTGYAPQNGICIASAKSLDTNCKVFNSSGFCTLCYANYFISSTGYCQAFNPLCKGSNATNGNCLDCYKGYTLTSGACTIVVKDPNCLVVNANNVCLNCSNRYYLKANKCTQVSSFCNNYDPLNGSCTTCYPGYKISNGMCIVGIDTNDAFCKQKDANNTCIQCYSNYFLSNGTCKQSNPVCKGVDANGLCTSCYPGFTLKNGTCSVPAASEIDPNCQVFSTPNSCTKCYPGYYVSNGKCVQNNNLCKTSNNGICTSCYEGYNLESGNCVIPAPTAGTTLAQRDPYCVKFIGNNCIQCANTYYLANNVCAQANPLCKSFIYASKQCSECYLGYSLQNGDCVVIKDVYIPYCQTLSGSLCVQCISGYYLQTSTSCAAVSILCATYNQNTGKCLSCVQGYFYQNEQCIYPSMGQDQYCILYDVSAYCAKCSQNYYLKSYRCTAVDPSCISFDYNTSSCTNCESGKSLVWGQCV